MRFTKWLQLAWDRAAAAVAITGGAVVILFGWIGVSGESDPARQLPYLISGGIFGLFVLALGALCWLSGELRDEWTELRRIHHALERIADSGLVNVTDGTAQVTDHRSGERSPGNRAPVAAR